MTAAHQDDPSPDDFTAAVAEELRVHMTRRRITGRELARRLGVSSQWISQRTRGIVALSTDDMQRISEAMGMDSPMELLAGIPFRGLAPHTTSRPAVRIETKPHTPKTVRVNRGCVGTAGSPFGPAQLALVCASVRAELARAKITGRQLARELNWDYPHLWRRLKGDVAFRADEIARIAGHLDVPITRLYGPPAEAAS